MKKGNWESCTSKSVVCFPSCSRRLFVARGLAAVLLETSSFKEDKQKREVGSPGPCHSRLVVIVLFETFKK